MKELVIFAALAITLILCFGIIKARSQVVTAGNKIIKLQKELWALKDTNDKLQNQYRTITTPENIRRKIDELDLSLIPPRQVISLKEEDMSGREVAAAAASPPVE